MNEQEIVLDWLSLGLKEVSNPYFELPSVSNSEKIIRERVFCYELYHQLRLLQMKDSFLMDFSLNGEIDKRGNTAFTGCLKNPDFVFHIPGTMNANACVIEVKGILDKSGIQKDFQTLLTFVSEFQYKQGVFILYNHSLQNLRSKITITSDIIFDKVVASKIDIICIQCPQCVVENIKLIDFLQEKN